MPMQTEENNTNHALLSEGVLAGASGKFYKHVEERTAKAASMTGVDEEKIERLPFDLSYLSDEGIFLNVRVCHYEPTLQINPLES